MKPGEDTAIERKPRKYGGRARPLPRSTSKVYPIATFLHRGHYRDVTQRRVKVVEEQSRNDDRLSVRVRSGVGGPSSSSSARKSAVEVEALMVAYATRLYVEENPRRCTPRSGTNARCERESR